MADSKRFKVFISSDGTDAGSKNELASQGDLTVNLGKSTERVVQKNAVHSYSTDEGFSVDGSFIPARPLSVAQAALMTAHDNETTVYAWIEDEATGGLSFEGDFKVAISNLDAPAQGVQQLNYSLSAEGSVTRGVVS
jgi:hypothetical protein